MRNQFCQEKTTQAAGLLLRLRGGHMSHLKLIKLLYLADRQALLRWGRPITFDQHVSMNHGPVLSQTLDLINGGIPPEEAAYWRRYIGERVDHEVELRPDQDCPTDQLSEAEEDLLAEVFAEFGLFTRWQIRDYVHTLPEWKDPNGSMLPIHYDEILQAGGMAPEEIAQVMAELEERSRAEELFG
jgi:uncharacterized phage-associated protein